MVDSPSPEPDDVVRDFHEHYYYSEVWMRTRWMGVNVYKCPFDLFVYQEILHEIRPALVVECGTSRGGSALFLAHVLDAIGAGRILTIDVRALPDRPTHPRIEYVHGSSTSPEVVAHVAAAVATSAPMPVMVILDSAHDAPHVSREIALYHPFVTVGSYLIVEDTNLHGHPVHDDGTGWGPGPMEATQEFLAREPRFVIDASREKFMMTFNPGGFLVRIA